MEMYVVKIEHEGTEYKFMKNASYKDEAIIQAVSELVTEIINFNEGESFTLISAEMV